MNEEKWLAEQFESNRDHLRAVAYRMLGSLDEADDAVQDAWLRLSRSDAGSIENLGGWLTTVVARISLDMLRSRKSRREQSLGLYASNPTAKRASGTAPDHESILADSIGLALLVVLEKLNPAERIAFVMHDMFNLPFDEIASVVGRSPTAARQLASRARRRVRGSDTVHGGDFASQRDIVDAFLAAARGGDFDALLAILDPDVVLRADRTAMPSGESTEIRGAANVANRAAQGRARAARAALVNGVVGVVVAPRGRLLMVIRFTATGGKIVEMDVTADPERLRQLDLMVLEE